VKYDDHAGPGIGLEQVFKALVSERPRKPLPGGVLVSFYWECPYCGRGATIDEKNAESADDRFDIGNKYGPLITRTFLVTCPNPDCAEIDLELALFKAENADFPPNYQGYKVRGEKLGSWQIIPASRAKVMPSYVPATIIEDYDEACAIETLSPKASATLARRCLQQILRNFFNVSEKTLYAEIQKVKPSLPTAIWESLDSLREIGNIGAHPEPDINVIVDVEPDEAATIIRVIEIVIEETYVARDRQKRYLAEVKKLADAKKAAKALPPPATP